MAPKNKRRSRSDVQVDAAQWGPCTLWCRPTFGQTLTHVGMTDFPGHKGQRFDYLTDLARFPDSSGLESRCF